MAESAKELQAELESLQAQAKAAEAQAVTVPPEEASRLGGIMTVLAAKMRATSAKLAEATGLEAKRTAAAEAKAAEKAQAVTVAELQAQSAEVCRAWEAWQDRYLALTAQVAEFWAECWEIRNRSADMQQRGRGQGLTLDGADGIRPEVTKVKPYSGLVWLGSPGDKGRAAGMRESVAQLMEAEK